MFNGISSAIKLAHLIVRDYVKPGDKVIDATAGNGKDTLFLAHLVGTAGRVYAFDVQEEALSKTKLTLEKEGLLNRVVLIHSGHEVMARHVKSPVKAVMFNLGYLPGSDQSVITKPHTTVTALQASLKLLVVGGITSLVVYTGHHGGEDELNEVKKMITGLDRKFFAAITINFVNRGYDAPVFIAIEKAGELNERQEAEQDN